MNCINFPSSFIINGPKSKGKTSLIKNILYMCRSKIKYVLILTETINYDIPNIKHNICGQNNFAQFIPMLKKYNRKAILIIDNISKYVNKINNSDIIKKTIININISIIFAARHTISIPKYLHEHARYVILFKTCGENKIKSIYNNYFKDYDEYNGKKITYNKLKKIVNNIIEHDFIIFDRRLNRMQIIIFNRLMY